MNQEGAVKARTEVARVRSVVAMIQVSDVEFSAAFYRLLGFEIGNFIPAEGPKSWTWLYRPGASDWKTAMMIAQPSDDTP